MVDLTQFPSINYLVKNCLDLADNSPNLGYPHQHPQHWQAAKNVFGEKEIYLPKGCNWYSWNGREKYAGGSTIVGKVGAESIPIFVKDRSIIPLAIKFGSAKGVFDITSMNRQHVTGVYIKIAFDSEANETAKGSQWRTKNGLEFIMFQDDGKTVLSQ